MRTSSKIIVLGAAVSLLALAGCGSDGGGGLGAQGVAASSAVLASSSGTATGMPDVMPSETVSAPPSAASSTVAPSASSVSTSNVSANVLVWKGTEPEVFGAKALELLKGAAIAGGLPLPNIATTTLKVDGTMNCGNASWKGADPTIPIFVFCKSTNSVAVVVEASKAAQVNKDRLSAQALVYDATQAWMYWTTGGVESRLMHACYIGVTLKGLATLPQVGVDVGSDFVDWMLAQYQGDFQRNISAGYTGSSACPKA